MPNNALLICRDVIVAAYQERLGLDFGASIAETAQGRQPVWRFVSSVDLISEVSADDPKSAGLVLDPEIGLLAYILPFHSVTAVHTHIKHALKLRSQLATERNYTDTLDETCDGRGAWRVVLHWLVEAGQCERWTKQIMEIRRETGFSEELAMDAIFITDGDVKKQVEEYGFPRLLFTTREVLKKNRLDEMTQWLSANRLVELALAGFAARFTRTEQCALADEVVTAMRHFKELGSPHGERIQAPEKARTFESIRIRNFRNLRDVRFEFGQDAVSASILHGPNGTGKSSLCEAISLALFGSSFRYKWFSDINREKDVSVRDRAHEYMSKYLAPIGDSQEAPQIALDKHALDRPLLVSADRTGAVDLAADGTILTQDSSLEFARMPSHELAARVLRGYSELAEHIEEYVESRMNQVDTVRKEFLRGLGLSAAITKIDTVYESIAKREIDRSLPPLPHTLVSWLELANTLPMVSGTGLGQQWRTWSDHGRNELAREFAVKNSEHTLVKATRRWLTRFNELSMASAEVLKTIDVRVAPIRVEFDSVASGVATWGEWMERKEEAADHTTSPEVQSLTMMLEELQAIQKAVVNRGQSAGGHFEHLSKVEAYVRETWSKEHANECPTCGADHSQHGGILAVVAALRTITTVERDRLRDEYTKVKTQIEETQKRLSELGRAQCPLSSREQSKLTETLQWLVPGSGSLSAWISVKRQRDAILASIAALRQLPDAPSPIDVDATAELVSRKTLSLFREADKTFDAPTNWKPVKEQLTRTLSVIVQEHLPRTLEKLWRELALNLTAAPWLLSGQLHIDISTRRGDQTSIIRVKDRLARYILNQAEIHTLGLAWFFTRYLTLGRFFQSCIVMDDPAHELDQTSFRDLCRLWETLMRLHRVYDRPLKLIVMLNQESRAVEAARATGAMLSVLGWEREQNQSIRTISVIGDGFHALQPAKVFMAPGA